MVIKEILLRPVTDKHDLAVKQNHAKGFLNDAAKVKIVIKLKEAVESKKAETAAEEAPAAIEPVAIEPAAIDAESIVAEEPKEIKNDKKSKKQ